VLISAIPLTKKPEHLKLKLRTGCCCDAYL
jgi:hypothetical protein